METISTNWATRILYFLLFAALAFVVFKLFFADSFVWSEGQGKERTFASRESFTIIYPEAEPNLEVTNNVPAVKQRLVNVYEALVKPAADLQMKPALALNWGLVDETTWEFSLRENVYFHDGSLLDASDVLASYARARNFEGSQLTTLFDTVERVEVVDQLTVRFLTKMPDPLLLQKLANLFIIPSEYEKRQMDKPVGTGPYQFREWVKGQELVLDPFEGYWGRVPEFKQVKILAVADKFDRVNKFAAGQADFLAFVPFDAVDLLAERGYQISALPSLEVQFLLFNTGAGVFEDLESRRYVAAVLNQLDLVSSLGNFAKRAEQFVSTGIFGFNPRITPVNDNFDTDFLAGQTITFHLPAGLTVLGEFVRKNLAEVGVNVLVSYLDGVAFMESLEAADADLYFLGYRSDLGDASSFLASVVRSGARFNFVDYENEFLDQLIDSSMVDMEVLSRRKALQEAMKIIVEDDVVALPLFEYEQVFAFNDRILFVPRIDGLIYLNDLIVLK